ncbi:alpha/beta hydrolase [Pseudanabaena sp. FACHB-2040]|uniref:alpha/beta fold hydrolase n=1 Tax=Pseudanabaena sp. FACHB-2040 TaxID=2692859 RepID=UPI0018EF69C9|nr:alpha/beta hydrolase [Pseudanabaena sp. FACHB-2040]
MPPQLTSHRVDLTHSSIFYQQGGVQFDQTPILFLHGWGISTDPYQEILELLAQKHPVLAPDLPSFARSSYSQLIPDYESYAQLLIQFLDVLGLKQVHLAGHSLGGGLAIAIAALAPERVKSAVLIGSTGIPVESILQIVPRRAIEMTVQTFLPRLKLKFWDIPQAFTYNLLFNTGNVVWALLLSLQADLRPLMPKVQARCLLVWSDKDTTIPMEIAQEMANTIPNAELTTVEEGCHEWGLWYPEKLTSIMLEFVTVVERANSQVAVAL